MLYFCADWCSDNGYYVNLSLRALETQSRKCHSEAPSVARFINISIFRIFVTCLVFYFFMFIFSFCVLQAKRKNEPKKKNRRLSKSTVNIFKTNFASTRSVKIYSKNKLCLIITTTAEPSYAFGVQGNLALCRPRTPCRRSQKKKCKVFVFRSLWT